MKSIQISGKRLEINLYFCFIMIEFKLEGEFIPLIQLLKATGLVQSGGEAQTVVEDGLVKYNGEVDYRKRLKVRIGDKVDFMGQKITII
jgi:ribosome-associated protein